MRLVDIRNGEIIVAVEEWEAERLAALSHLAELGAHEGQSTEDKRHLETIENAMLASALRMFWEVTGVLAAEVVDDQPLSEKRQGQALARQRAGQRQAEAWGRLKPEQEPAA